MLVHLPEFNAALNSISAVLLLTGLVFIKRKNIPAHKACMTSAFFVSIAFLVSYLVHHWRVGSVKYTGTGTLRTVYFAILLSHLVLAAIVPFLAVWTLRLGWHNEIESHRRWAKITLPVWLYVSVTGVVIYLMLYRFQPGTLSNP